MTSHSGKDSGVVFDPRSSPALPSDDLVRGLTELQLCRLRDFQQARGLVRRLARDLPPFDSVWIDALVQLRRLTPYQARVLEEGTATELRVGSFVILDELGRGPHARTFLAKRADRSDRCVVKRLRLAIENRTECRRRFDQLLERTSGWSHPHLVVPHLMEDGALVEDHPALVSRFIPGVPLSELLVRRGRFPASIVLDVARQLLEGLASLDRRGLVHGDIRLSNVRLTDRGLAVLVDGGVRPAVCPELTIHQSFALEGYDGIAPELIGTGAAPNAASELYALGCLLWQLLAGRPPHPMADPLMKLAAHQTQRIEDVRTWAPDTPSLLADAVFAMTSPRPDERPRSFDELLQRWGHSGRRSRARLTRYRRQFNSAVPHLAQPETSLTSSRWPWIAAALFVATGAALSFADKGLRNDLLALTNRITVALHQPAGTSRETDDFGTKASGSKADLHGLLPLPPPSADGEIVLAEAGPYDVADVAVNGPLTIRGAAGVRPVLQIGREPLRLAAETVSLTNVFLRRETESDAVPLAAMLLIRAQRVTVESCEFVLSPVEGSSSSSEATTAALGWLPQNTVAQRGPSDEVVRFDFANTTFLGSGPALLLADSPRVVRMVNCLKLGGGACLTLGRKATAQRVVLELDRVTLRDSGPLLRFGGAFAARDAVPPMELSARDCVFAVASHAPGLIEVQTEATPRTDLAHSVRMTGLGSVVPLGTNLLVVTLLARRETSPLSEADEQFEGLIASDLEFAGPSTHEAAASQLVRLSAPRSSQETTLPGIDPARLPGSLRE